MDWLLKYLGKRWTQEHNCGYWFRKIQKEVFGRNIPVIINKSGTSPRAFATNACRVIRSLDSNPELRQWKKTDNPVDGDAAFIALRNLPHHIGLVVFYEGFICILHALETNGVQLTKVSDLNNQNYKITSYYHYAD
jgi:hypothetical protein